MDRLEQLILHSRLLSADQLAALQRDAQHRHKRLSQRIVESGLVDERRFAEWMAEASGVRLLDPLPVVAIGALSRRIPRAIAREFVIAPVAVEGDTIVVAAMNPLDDACVDILRTTTGMSVRLVPARYSALTDVIARHYPEDEAEMTILPPGASTLPASTEVEELGNATRYIPPEPVGEDTNRVRQEPSQLDRIERKLDELAALVQRLTSR
jgi:hypothetical protein